MIKEKKKLIRKIIISIIGVLIIIALKNNNVYALSVNATNMDVYTTKEFFVSGASSNSWKVYTKDSGTNPNSVYGPDGKGHFGYKNIVQVTKRTDRGYTRIECKGLNSGTVRIYIQDRT